MQWRSWSQRRRGGARSPPRARRGARGLPGRAHPSCRQKIAKEAESLVEEERIIFLEWWASLEAVPVINKLRSDLELIRKEELQKALSRMGPDFSARERKVVEALTKGIINKILHTPVTKLRSPQSREERQVSLKIVEKLFSLVEEEKNN